MARLLLILLIMWSSLSLSQTERLIEVFGNSEISVSPDNLVWSINISKESNSIPDIKKEVDQSTNEILNILSRKGIPDYNIQTSGISLNKNYYSDEKSFKFSGSNQITVKLQDVKLYTSIIDEIIEIENVFPQSPLFNYSKEIETRARIREEALLAAKDKASTMASVLGLKTGRIIRIDEQPSNIYYPSPFNYSTSRTDETAGVNSFREGQIKISASVKLILELTN